MPSAGEVVRSSSLPDHEARRLVSLVTGCSLSALVGDPVLDAEQFERFRRLEARRLAGEPLQYVEGDVPFGPASIRVDPRVLIPRPETEELFELARAAVERPAVVVDLCTGSGNLAVALAMTFPDADVYATDVSEDAIDVARANASANGVDVTFGVGDLFAPLPSTLVGRVELLVANPPYLARAELADVPDDVLREPSGALVAGPTGLEIVARIAADIGPWLAPGAVVMLEVSEFHAARAAALFADLGGEVRTDLFGSDRFVVGHARVE